MLEVVDAVVVVLFVFIVVVVMGQLLFGLVLSPTVPSEVLIGMCF